MSKQRREIPAAAAMRRRLGDYEIGRTLGEGNFGKVNYARHVVSGQPFAVKILDRRQILSLKIDGQIKREIGTLKLLKHPNVVRLHEVLASKTKIYMVLEYINGGELFEQIESKGKLGEAQGRKLFQQLIDAVGYCHGKGIYHRDLKPENILIDRKGNLKVSDFGLSAITQDLGNDGLLHTTCGSPNYIAPEVLANRGYDGSMSDIWSCGVILYVILTGYLPFQDRNIAVLYQKIFKGDARIPKTLSCGAQDIIRRILDPDPATRIDLDGIRAHEWFDQDYVPAVPNIDDEVLSFAHEDAPKVTPEANGENSEKSAIINAFELISIMSSSLDLSGLFETEDVSERKTRFTSNFSPKDLFEKIECVVMGMGFQVQKGNAKVTSTFACLMLSMLMPIIVRGSAAESGAAELGLVEPKELPIPLGGCRGLRDQPIALCCGAEEIIWGSFDVQRAVCKAKGCPGSACIGKDALKGLNAEMPLWLAL